MRLQAIKILGSCDFLGNPLGLAQDVREGLTAVIRTGDLSSVFQGTTRGIANSTSKFIGAVADTVSQLAADPTYEEDRRRRRTRENSEFGNVVDGLAYGVVGGITSVFSQTFNGMKNDGPAGIITGFGKGVVGAVVKPVTGKPHFSDLTIVHGLYNCSGLRLVTLRDYHRWTFYTSFNTSYVTELKNV